MDGIPGVEVPTTLTANELATLAATTPARIQRLAEIGVLRPDAIGRFAPADIQRVRIALAYEDGGIELEHIAQAIAEGLMSFEFPTGSIQRPARHRAGPLRISPVTSVLEARSSRTCSWRWVCPGRTRTGR